jgi:hypothetical protein
MYKQQRRAGVIQPDISRSCFCVSWVFVLCFTLFTICPVCNGQYCFAGVSLVSGACPEFSASPRHLSRFAMVITVRLVPALAHLRYTALHQRYISVTRRYIYEYEKCGQNSPFTSLVTMERRTGNGIKKSPIWLYLLNV